MMRRRLLRQPLRYRIRNALLSRQGRYVEWGGRRQLDVQIGSPRDLALARVARREARWDRVWADLMERSRR